MPKLTGSSFEAQLPYTLSGQNPVKDTCIVGYVQNNIFRERERDEYLQKWIH